MITASVVLSNLAYLIGAVVLATIGALLVVLRHRKPKSVEANVASFNRGLRALAPEAPVAVRRHTIAPSGRPGVRPLGSDLAPAGEPGRDAEAETG